MIHQCLSTRFGEMMLFSDDGDRLIALALPNKEEESRRWLKRHYRTEVTNEGEIAAAQPLIDYFSGDLNATRRVRWQAKGTAFQLQVWNALYKIPLGQTTTYARIASEIGKPDAVRAVGAANGANPIAIVVPCHRVVGSDGSLTGFGGGLPLKLALLQHEGAQLRSNQSPGLFD